MAKRLKEIEIPFGAYDSELDGFEYTIPEGYKAEIKDGKVVVRKTESEDERIRKEMIFYFQEEIPQCSIQEHADKMKEFIAWLEKQGKQKDILEDAILDSNKDGLIADTIRYKREKQGKQKPADKVEPKFKVGQTIKKEGFNLGFTIVKIEDGFYYNDMGDYFPFTDQDNWELVEQNPAWSEEDEEKVKAMCEDGNLKPSERAWLKSLKDRVQPQPKQEWSEEDEGMLNEVILGLKVLKYKDSGEEEKAAYQREIDWLEFFKYRYTWKPSDEQMGVIEAVINNRLIQRRHLDSLYADLKKLRGE